VCESQLAARLQGEVETLQKDKEEVQSALQAAREKVHSLEVLMASLNQDTVTQDTHDNQASSTRLQHSIYASILRIIMLCSPEHVYQCLRTCCLHLQGRKGAAGSSTITQTLNRIGTSISQALIHCAFILKELTFLLLLFSDLIAVEEAGNHGAQRIE
jgi:hypothetical protein